MEIHLRELRESRKLKQKELAKILGVKVRTYGSWERGEVMPSLKQAYDCAVVLECTIDEIAGRKVEKPSYADPGQKQLNSCYENMNPDGRSTLVRLARSMEKDAANRIVKSGEEPVPDLVGA